MVVVQADNLLASCQYPLVCDRSNTIVVVEDVLYIVIPVRTLGSWREDVDIVVVWVLVGTGGIADDAAGNAVWLCLCAVTSMKHNRP